MRELLEAVPGVQQARVDFDAQLAQVSFDGAKTTVAALCESLRTGGYQAWSTATETRSKSE